MNFLSKSTTTAAVFLSVACVATEDAYYTPPAQPAQSYGYPPQTAQQGFYYNVQNNYYRNFFPQPRPIIDPKYYQTVLSGFKQCVDHKCRVSHAYGSSSSDALDTVGTYTACVASCAATEMMRVVSEFKTLFGKLIDIGSANLASSHRYLAGKEEYDVLKENTRIDTSCCLPNDYFVPWNNIVFPATVKFPESSSFDRLISIKSYLDYCVQVPGESDNYLFLDKFEIDCDLNWMKYIRELQQNVGHLVLAPKCATLAPAKSCCDDEQANPEAAPFREAMCVATECLKNGKRQLLQEPLLKYPIPATDYENSCPSDASDDIEVYYQRVPLNALEYYTVDGGLPSAYNEESAEVMLSSPSDPCTYEFSFVDIESNRFRKGSSPTEEMIAALEKCPSSGRFEFCNMKQYVNWLQEQLFDLGACPLVDLKNGQAEGETIPDSPYAYYTLGCLYRVISLKCDCMEAVLNCYENEYEFTSSLGKTLGKAASVLCGFILCQKPSVYSLLGGQQAISNANIMKQVLIQVGAINSDSSAFPPVTFAFLSFGMGVVAFLVTKATIKVATKKQVGVEDGYRNLI